MLDTEDPSEMGLLRDFSLVLHGTKVSPYIGQTNGLNNRKLQYAKRLHQQ